MSSCSGHTWRPSRSHARKIRSASIFPEHPWLAQLTVLRFTFVMTHERRRPSLYHSCTVNPGASTSSGTGVGDARTTAATSARISCRTASTSISLDGRKYGITCGQIDIGNAATPMTARMAGGVPQANGTMMPEPTMDAKHVGDAVAYMANLPPDANVHTITVMASKMPFVGRG